MDILYNVKKNLIVLKYIKWQNHGVNNDIIQVFN